MITTIFIYGVLYILNRYKKINICPKEFATKLTFMVLMMYSYMYLLISMDYLYVVDMDSNIDSTELNMLYRGEYVGEIKDDKVLIYQEDKDIEISKELFVINESKNNEKLELIKIGSKGNIRFTNRFNEFLAKDFLFDKIVVSRESELENNVTEIYSITTNNKNIVKGVD